MSENLVSGSNYLNVRAFLGNGRVSDTYEEDSGTYTSPSGFYDKLEKDTRSSSHADFPNEPFFTKTEKNGIVWEFDRVYGGSAKNIYACTKIEDPWGNDFLFRYDDTVDPTLLTKITDTEGREVTFTRTSGRITKVTVSSSAVGDYGNLEIDYEYTGDRLTKVTKHDTRQADGGSKVRPYTEYTYLTTGVFVDNLDLVKDCGTTVLNFDYTAYNTDEDRCTKVTDADGEIHEYAHDQTDSTDDWTRYTDPFDQECDFVYEDLSASDRTVKERRDWLEDETGADISTAAVTKFTRDCDCGRITEIEYTDSSKEKWEYDSYGNITKYTRVSKNGTDTDLVKKWTYDTFANYSRLLTSSGWLRKEANPSSKITWTWDANGLLDKVAHPTVTTGQPSSQTIEFDYAFHSDGTLKDVIAPNEDKVSYSYSGDDITKTEDPDTGGLQREWVTERDLFGNTTSTEDPSGSTSAWDYTVTPDGRVLKVEGPNGQETKYEYDLCGRRTKEDKLLSGTSTRVVTLFTYSDGGELEQIEADDGGIEAISTSDTDYANRRAISLNPDEYGSRTDIGYGYHNLSWKTHNRDDSGASPVDTLTETIERDTMGRVTARVHQDDRRTEYEYDGYGRLTKTLTDLPSSKQREIVLTLKDWGAVSVSETKVGTTTYAKSASYYDEALRLYKVTQEDPDNVLADRTVEYERDENGRVAIRTDARGEDWETQWDAAGRTKKTIDPIGNEVQYSYDDANRKTTITSHEKDTSDSTFTDYIKVQTRDASGRITAVKREGSTNGNRTSTFTYDKAGRRLDMTTPEGFKTEWEYDKLGRVTEETKPIDSGQVPVLVAATTKTISKGGLVTEVTDANGNDTDWTYDSFGRELTVTYNNGVTTSIYTKTYEDGRIKTVTDPLGAVSTYVYDDGGRLDRIDVAKNTSGLVGPDRMDFDYDDMDRVTTGKTQSESMGSYTDITSVTREYNGYGEMDKETQYGSHVFEYEYDAGGALKEITYPSGGPIVGVRYTMDAVGRVDKVERKLSTGVEGISTSQWEDAALFEYEGHREIERDQGPYDLLRTQTWTSFREPSILKYEKDSNSTLLSGLVYYWDDDGRMVVRTRSHDEDTYKWGEVFRYDEMNRLVKMWRDAQDPGNYQSTAPTSNYDDKVEYNLGKVYERADVKVTPEGGSATTTDYTSNDFYQYTDVGGTTQTWDANGQLTDNGDWAFEWTAQGQLAEADPDTGTTREYKYDAFKRRVETTVGSDVVEYVYLNWHMIGEHDGTDWLWQEIPMNYGEGMLEHIALDTNDIDDDLNTTEFRQYAVHEDFQNTVWGISDTAAAIVERYRYREPFGDTYTEDSSSTNIGGFASEAYHQKRLHGGVVDSVLRQYDFRNRWLDTLFGLWMSRDPIGFHGPMSLYQYVQANPASMSDAYGECETYDCGECACTAEQNTICNDLTSSHQDNIANNTYRTQRDQVSAQFYVDTFCNTTVTCGVCNVSRCAHADFNEQVGFHVKICMEEKFYRIRIGDWINVECLWKRVCQAGSTDCPDCGTLLKHEMLHQICLRYWTERRNQSTEDAIRECLARNHASENEHRRYTRCAENMYNCITGSGHCIWAGIEMCFNAWVK